MAATEGGQPGIVGTAVVRRRMPTVDEIARRFDPEVSAELGRVVVAPAWRRQGIAIGLADAARAWARAFGYQTLHLHTEQENAPALALWRAIANEIPRPNRPAHESVYFEIPIALPVRRRAPARPGGYFVRLARPEDLAPARALMLRVLEDDYGYGYRSDLHFDMDDLQGHYLRHPRQALATAIDEATGTVIAVGCVQQGGRFPHPASGRARRPLSGRGHGRARASIHGAGPPQARGGTRHRRNSPALGVDRGWVRAPRPAHKHGTRWRGGVLAVDRRRAA